MLGINMTQTVKKYSTAVIVILVVYLAMKYVSPIASPFLLALLLSGLLNPLASALHKKIKIKKSILAGIILFIAAIIFIVAIWLLLSALFTGGGKLACQMPDYQEELSMLLCNCCDLIEQHFGIDGVQIEEFVLEQVNILIENLEVNILPAVMGKSMDYAKNIAGFVSFLVVMIIAALLIVKDYDRLIQKLKEEQDFRAVREIGEKIILYIKTFIRAQLIILCIISALCAVVLTLSGMKGGIFYGVVTGIMDMLPFIGTGIMLIPLALYQLISGRYILAFLYFFLYAVCALIREFLEPKLIGDRVGLWPVGILFAVFAGLHLFGIWGIIKGPLSLVIICETCKYLWDLQAHSAQPSYNENTASPSED